MWDYFYLLGLSKRLRCPAILYSASSPMLPRWGQAISGSLRFLPHLLFESVNLFFDLITSDLLWLSSSKLYLVIAYFTIHVCGVSFMFNWCKLFVHYWECSLDYINSYLFNFCCFLFACMFYLVSFEIFQFGFHRKNLIFFVIFFIYFKCFIWFIRSVSHDHDNRVFHGLETLNFCFFLNLVFRWHPTLGC